MDVDSITRFIDVFFHEEDDVKFQQSLKEMIKNLKKKLKQIDDLEEKLSSGLSLNEDQQAKVSAKGEVLQELKTLEDMV